MTFDVVTLLAAIVIFVATITRATFGFGEALIAMPLLSMLLSIRVAAPLIALISVTVASMILVTDWRHIHLRSAGRLVLSSLLGIPLGLNLVAELPENAMKTILACIIIGFSTYSLMRRHELELRSDRFAYLFGFLAGILGGAYNTHGPPLIVYGTLKRWSAEHFRATLQGYFLPTGVVIVVGHGLNARLTPHVMSCYLASLPLVLLALIGGSKLNRYVRDRGFARYVHGMLIVIGLSLLAESLLRR